MIIINYFYTFCYIFDIFVTKKNYFPFIIKNCPTSSKIDIFRDDVRQFDREKRTVFIKFYEKGTSTILESTIF